MADREAIQGGFLCCDYERGKGIGRKGSARGNHQGFHLALDQVLRHSRGIQDAQGILYGRLRSHTRELFMLHSLQGQRPCNEKPALRFAPCILDARSKRRVFRDAYVVAKNSSIHFPLADRKKCKTSCKRNDVLLYYTSKIFAM